jgi:hypothetical protein
VLFSRHLPEKMEIITAATRIDAPTLSTFFLEPQNDRIQKTRIMPSESRPKPENDDQMA